MKLLDAKNIHIVGIGGIGISGLAQILKHRKKKISGSDLTISDLTKSLKLSGIKVVVGHDAKNVTKFHDLVIYSQAIPLSNVEIKKAQSLGIQIMSYPEALGELTKEYYTIAISGTHGKSTTTAMVAKILMMGDLDPTVVIGTKMKELGNKNYRVGESNYLVIEACEYKESFLNFHPNIAIITNVEKEHLDYFQTFEYYKEAFSKFAQRLPDEGTLIINGDDSILKKISHTAGCQVMTWGKNKKFGFQYKNGSLIHLEDIDQEVQKIDISLQIPGEFNIKNACNAAIVGHLLNIQPKNITKALKSFRGTWRRMQLKKFQLGNLQFIDDYAHHPTAISVTLRAIRENNPDKKILCVFQPHQYSRTKLLLKEFGRSFSDVDEVIIPNIYRVRDSEEDVKSVSVDNLVAEIKKHRTKVHNGKSLEHTAKEIVKNHKKYDLVVTMGAGDIEKIYKLLKK